MPPRLLPSPIGNVCWSCRWRIANEHRIIPTHPGVRDRKNVDIVSRRAFRATARRLQGTTPIVEVSGSLHPAILDPSLPIRSRLKIWQDTYGGPNTDDLRAFANHPLNRDIQNGMAKMNPGIKADESPPDYEAHDGGVGEDGSLITIGLFLKPGDVVVLSQPGSEPVLAVFVQQLDTLAQFYSVNGRWCHASLHNVSFAIPGCIHPTLVEPLVPFLPTNADEASTKAEIAVPREAGTPIQQILEKLTRDSERIYREDASVLDNAYTFLADQTRTRMMTLTQIARTLLAPRDLGWKPSSAALLAVRKALNHNVFRFRPDGRSHRLTNVIAIRPQNDVQNGESVLGWIRQFVEHQALQVTSQQKDHHKRPSKEADYVIRFIEKARRLIAVSRQTREPRYGFMSPSLATGSARRTSLDETFDSTDQQIINFFQAWVLTRQYNDMPNLHSACSMVLTAIGCYDADVFSGDHPNMHNVGRETGHLFLQEIGVITPYENIAVYDEQLMLPTVRLSRNLELLSSKAEIVRRKPDFRDSMAALRRDWGDLNVYCIDNVGAKEIDDGISIENVAGTDSQVWVHVHVANPTAFFDKTHVLSGLAAHMTETVYTPERSFPMLPAWVTQQYFSLDQNRPVLTFSTRFDKAAGVVLETQVQPGIIRCVTSITPGEVAAYLGESTEDVALSLVVGGKIPHPDTERKPPVLSPAQVEELKNLYATARASWRMRENAGAIRFSRTTSNARVFSSDGNPGLPWTPPSVTQARFIRDDPVIEIATDVSDDHGSSDISAMNITEEMMLLACQTAAAWCAERNIPAMYRGTIRTPGSIIEDPDLFIKEVVRPYLQSNGRLSNHLGYKYIEALGRSIVHSSPIPHRIIGAASYLRVTSPLRRFSDMISHWQIEAAVRYESRTGQKFDYDELCDTASPILPFSQSQMQESIITLTPREKLIAETKRNTNRFWHVLAFMRAFFYKEAPLPDKFTALLHRPLREGASYVHGIINDHALEVAMVKSPGIEYQLGDIWEVSIRAISVFERTVYVNPVRLLSREKPAF